MVRLLKLGVYDPAYLHVFYENRPGLAEAPYAEQHGALIADRAASSDFWTAALGDRGYETADLIANAAPLRRSWAIERAMPIPGGAREIFEITAAQVKAFVPEVLVVADTGTFGADFLRTLREDCPSIRLVAGWCGAPWHDLAPLREWDLALSCVPELVEELRARGLAAHHVDHGFAPVILTELGTPGDEASFTFLGSIVKRHGYHHARERLLLRLIEATPLELRSNMMPEGGRLRRLVRRLLGRDNALDPRLVDRALGPLYGLAMFRQLRDSAVTLNTHIDASRRSASNMRLFEATGVGTCLLTDWKDNIGELFEPDHEVVTYRSAEEAIEKYNFLAAHPHSRAAIAAAGQRRTLRDHGFGRRAARIDTILRAALASA